MLQPRRQLDLALEPLGTMLRDQLRVEHLEGNGPLVPEIPGEEDHGHAAPAELTLEGVAATKGFVQHGVGGGHGGSPMGTET